MNPYILIFKIICDIIIVGFVVLLVITIHEVIKEETIFLNTYGSRFINEFKIN